MASISFAIPEPTLAYMRQRILRETKRKLINTLVAEQVAAFEEQLREKFEELLGDLTIEQIEVAHNSANMFGPKLHTAVFWNSKRIRRQND